MLERVTHCIKFATYQQRISNNNFPQQHYNNIDRDDTYPQIARSLSTGRLLASPPMSSEEASSADEGGGRRRRRDDTESSDDSYSTGESDTESDDEVLCAAWGDGMVSRETVYFSCVNKYQELCTTASFFCCTH